MRNWLIFIGAVVVILLGVAIWLASAADDNVPPEGEIRQEIENVL